MYAVLVIAAILLSVGPMHARTILAALPAGTPGHQFAPDQTAQPETRAHFQKAARQSARPARATCAPGTPAAALTTPAPFETRTSQPPPSACWNTPPTPPDPPLIPSAAP